MITKRDAAIISTYTGRLMGELNDTVKYMEELARKNPDKNIFFDDDARKAASVEDFKALNLGELEGNIITAYTGIGVGSFASFHGYADELLGFPTMTHEFAFGPTWWALHEKASKAWAYLSENLKD